MSKYEMMFILSPDLTEAKRKKVVAELNELLEAKKVDIFHQEDWEKRDLAYTIKKQNEGYYLLYYFTMPNPRDLFEIDEHMRLDQSILRHLIIKRDEDYTPQDFSEFKFEYEKETTEEAEEKDDKKKTKAKKVVPIPDDSVIDYKNGRLLFKYTSRYGKIVARQYNKGVTLNQQKKLAKAVKRARFIALMPFVQ
jgi:small subunit ribosomal protein S6